MPSQNIKNCSRTIADKGLSIAFAESATAGRMCSEFSLTDYSGKILRGGISCYEVLIKEKIMKVPHELIEKFTPESAEVTASLAENAASIFESDIAVAVTGLTTPGGSETKQKPVGTMFIHVVFPNSYVAHREVFSGSQEEIVEQTVERTASLILEKLNSNQFNSK
ncbi:MAG TPA: CinA family protein [Flavobacterium sp.]|nr:CinA family protein [Flavobacterium sp.]